MKKHYELLISKFNLPDEASCYLLSESNKVFAYMDEFKAIIAKFYKVKNVIALIENELNALAKKADVKIYTLHFILLACASKYMLDDFKRANIEEQIFWDTIEDLKYKLFECKKVKGYWGNFVAFWYNIFYTFDIYKLGRLEYERVKYNGEDYEKSGVSLKKGDTVYSVHIPSCGSLSKDLRISSYKKAYEFFSDELNGKPLICVCESWLLFPENREIFPNTINLVDFMNDWDITHSKEQDVFYDAWRVFGKDYEKGNVETKTSQQNALAKWLDSGKKTGEGFGILVFDGEKIINS